MRHDRGAAPANRAICCKCGREVDFSPRTISPSPKFRPLLHNPMLDSNTVIKVENEIRAVHGLSLRTGADHGATVITVNGKAQ